MVKKYLGAAATALMAALPIFNSHAADIRDQIKVTTGKAELVFPDKDANAVAARVQDAVSQFGITMDVNFRSLPAEVSPWPDRPAIKQVYIQGTPLVEYQCPTAYAEFVKKPAPIRNNFMFMFEVTQFCFYSFDKGVKAYVIFHRAKKTESLTSGLFEGIAKTIQGSDEERITKQLQETLDIIKAKDPAVLVARFEVPGKPVQEPDKVGVDTLIPARPASQAQQNTSMQPTPMAAATVPGTPRANTQQAKIEARKNLNAMGMTYHAQNQFIAAIQRKDDVAVQLFLDGDGINPSAKDAAGLSPIDVANQLGAADIAQLIQVKIDSKSKPVAAPAQAQPAAAALSSVAATPAPNGAKALSTERLAEIDAALDARKMSPEQREIARAKLIQQVQRLQEMTGQMN